MSSRVLWLAALGVLLVSPVALGELADPTRPPGSFERESSWQSPEKSGPEGELVVSSILISPERRIAVINGKRVEPGDSVAEATVREITPSGVWLEGPDGEVELRLASPGVKFEASPRNTESE